MLRPLLLATQFLTRLPLPATLLQETDYRPQQLGQSVLFYPLVGLLIGGILAALVYVLQRWLPPFSAQLLAALVLLCWVLLTGALHLDGLADSADAWVGGYGDRDKTLAIMKDPYCGPAGVVAVVLVLLVKFAGLAALMSRPWPALCLAPLLARGSILLLFLTTPYVRKQGIGAPHAAYLPRKAAWLVLFLMLAGVVYGLRMQALWLLLFVVPGFVLLRQLMMQRLGGTTGDTAGAMVELLEALVLLVFAA